MNHSLFLFIYRFHQFSSMIIMMRRVAKNIVTCSVFLHLLWCVCVLFPPFLLLLSHFLFLWMFNNKMSVNILSMNKLRVEFLKATIVYSGSWKAKTGRDVRVCASTKMGKRESAIPVPAFWKRVNLKRENLLLVKSKKFSTCCGDDGPILFLFFERKLSNISFSWRKKFIAKSQMRQHVQIWDSD